jgi:DNA-nicking Smr family endonuclease
LGVSERQPPRPADDPDAEAFADAMRDVVPLARDHRQRVRATPPLPRPAQPSRTPPARSQDDEPDEEDAGFVAAGVDRRELRKLRRGSSIPGRRLDLHGMPSRAAITAVEQFIATSRRAFRCVAIVHGRGLHSDGNIAVLRKDVRALLRRHPAVLAYADAPRDAGGSGAVHVLLRG